MSNERAFAHFQAAREHYLARRFAKARTTMQRYRQAIDYNQFERGDRRDTQAPGISVIIVSFQSGTALLDCLRSVIDQQGSRFEVILVDNGGNQNSHTEIATLPLLWIRPPINLLPSEGRNLGAHFARGELLAFLDDDALMVPGYLAEACSTLEERSILAIRGRVLPKTASSHVLPPQQYDLGESPRPAELNLEGNCVIRRDAFAALRGFDPLLFGHEGKELTRRCRASYSQQKILYWPALVIRHDYAQEERLAAKRERQALAIDYLKHLKESPMNTGVSILVRAGDNLAAADDFLASLCKHNTYKPIEILIATSNIQKGLKLIRAYLGRVLIRLLRTSGSDISHVAQTFRYDNILILDLPFLLDGDLVGELISNNKRTNHLAKYCQQDFRELKGFSLVTPLANLNAMLDDGRTTKEWGGKGNDNSTSGNVRIALDAPSTQQQISFPVPLPKAPRTPLAQICNNGARIIGGMATIPQRQATLQEVLSRLAPQFDELHVYLNGYTEIPNIREQENVVFHLSEAYGDLGAKGKFFGLNFAGADDYYFSLDDDFLYPEDYVEVMIMAMRRYKDLVGVCVHGSIFGNPLDWYFERTATFSARQGLDRDRFINLTGTGTFACKLSNFPIEFIDVMPRTMCDLQISVKARNLKIPLVSIKRCKNWLRSIKVDIISANGEDYWSKMLMNDEGRTEIAKNINWDFDSCKDYILDVLKVAQVSLHDYDRLIAEGFDVEFIVAANGDNLPNLWNSNESEIYFLRKYQYYASLLTGGRSSMKRNEILRAPNYASLGELKTMALEFQNKWEARVYG